MKKICYILSFLLHALLLLIILNARFQVTIRSEPARVVAVRIAEPPLPFFPGKAAVWAPAAPSAAPAAPASDGSLPGGIAAASGNGGPSPAMNALLTAAGGGFRLARSGQGTFRLAPVGNEPRSLGARQRSRPRIPVTAL